MKGLFRHFSHRELVSQCYADHDTSIHTANGMPNLEPWIIPRDIRASTFQASPTSFSIKTSLPRLGRADRGFRLVHAESLVQSTEAAAEVYTVIQPSNTG